MLERLKLALMLPFSRKVLVALAAGSLAWANKRFELGLSDDVIKFLIGAACFVILGIAIEDHGKARAKGEAEAGYNHGLSLKDVAEDAVSDHLSDIYAKIEEIETSDKNKETPS